MMEEGGSTTTTRESRHAVSASEKQRELLNKLFKDPSKPVFIPPAPKEKTLRPPREMMKNVQGSSAGAGSGEFHVYKANRRREYERIKLMEEESEKEASKAEFERKKRERESEAKAKTAKNRAKRLKKKERATTSRIRNGTGSKEGEAESTLDESSGTKKRRLVNEAGFDVLNVEDKAGPDGDAEDVLKETSVGSEQLRVVLHDD